MKFNRAFDGNWRDAVTDESADPTLAFIPGAQVDCGPLGIGEILNVESRGYTKLLKIKFRYEGERILPLNLQSMKIVEEENGDDDS